MPTLYETHRYILSVWNQGRCNNNMCIILLGNGEGERKRSARQRQRGFGSPFLSALLCYHSHCHLYVSHKERNNTSFHSRHSEIQKWVGDLRWFLYRFINVFKILVWFLSLETGANLRRFKRKSYGVWRSYRTRTRPNQAGFLRYVEIRWGWGWAERLVVTNYTTMSSP